MLVLCATTRKTGRNKTQMKSYSTMSKIPELCCEPCLFIKLEKVKADFLCEDCLENYCEKCALDHAKFRVFRNHQISQLSSDGEYENVDYLTPVNVSEGRQRIDDSHTASCDEDTLRITKETGSSSVMAPELFRETALFKTPTGSHGDSISFKVKVKETDLIKLIPGLDRDCITESIFLFTVNKTKISLFLEDREVFTCALNTVRRYGRKGKLVSMEVGRRCELGPGELHLISDQAKDIHSALGRMIRTHISKTE